MDTTDMPDSQTSVLFPFQLKTLGIVDSPPEDTFDDLTQLAQTIFEVPVTLISIVELENDRQYFKSQIGLPEPWAGDRQTPLSHSFCQHVVASNAPLVVENAPTNSLVCTNLAIRDLNVVSYLGVPIYDPDGTPIGALCVIDGVPRQWSKSQVETLRKLGACVSDAIRLKAAVKTSELLRSEEKKLITGLEQANVDLQQFAYVAAHDLQEPLRKIVSFCKLLSDECIAHLSKDGLVYLDYVVNGASRMQTLIKDLLEFSRVESRGQELSRVSVAAALERALQNLGSAIDESKTEITTDDLSVEVAADLPQLAQLFQNLIGNGIKYHDGRPRIHIGIQENDGGYVVSVNDDGIGIAPAYHEQIFGIFKRLHGKSEYVGTGIGLAICKRIVERWHQKIWVESCPGIGSTFYFTVEKIAQAELGSESSVVPGLERCTWSSDTPQLQS